MNKFNYDEFAINEKNYRRKNNMEASIDNLVTLFKENSDKRICVLGTTCTGKSTLIKLILKEEEVSRGNIIINGKDITYLKPRRVPYLRRSMGGESPCTRSAYGPREPSCRS